MSIDRYLAVVHAIDSMASYRTTKNTTISIMYEFLCFIVLLSRDFDYIVSITNYLSRVYQ